MSPAPSPGILLDTSAIGRHLQLLGKDPATVRLRAFLHKDNPRKWHIKDNPTGIKARKTQGLDVQALALWQREQRNLYLVINDGGDTKASITGCRAFWLEWDDREKAWQLNAWQELGLPRPTFIIDTGGKSLHCYWVLSEPIAPDVWAPIQSRLIDHAGADQAVKDPSRVLRLAGSAYIGPDGLPHDRASFVEAHGTRYTAEQIAAALPPEPVLTPPAATPGPLPTAGASITGRPPLVLDDGTRPEQPARSLDQIRQALDRIPAYASGRGQRREFIRFAGGLRAAVKDAGGTDDTALDLALAHSPGVHDLADYWLSKWTEIDAGSFWWIADQHGYDLRATSAAPAQPRPAGHQPDPPPPASRPPDEEIAAIFEQLLDLQTSTRDTWAKEHALRADLWRMGVPASAIDERIYYALAKRWNLPLQTSHTSGPRGRSIADPLDSQASDLVPGFLLWQRDHVLFGAGGAGKTLAAAALAVSCIKGQPFLDQEIPPSITGRVLWIGTDGGEGARAMVRDYLEDLGVADDPEIIAGFNVWSAEGSRQTPSWAATPSGLQELRDELETGGYALVVIDSLKAVLELAGINFSIGPVGTLMRLMQALVGRHCSLLWLHHPAGGKAAGKGLTAAAGSQNINQIPSAVHQITRITSDRGPINTWSVHKLRGAQSREFTYRLAEEGLQLVDGQITKNIRAALLDSIDLRIKQGVTTATPYLQQEMPQHNESTIRNNLTWLRKRGFISKKGRDWALTHQGQKLLSLSVQGVDLDHWVKGNQP